MIKLSIVVVRLDAQVDQVGRIIVIIEFSFKGLIEINTSNNTYKLIELCVYFHLRTCTILILTRLKQLKKSLKV